MCTLVNLDQTILTHDLLNWYLLNIVLLIKVELGHNLTVTWKIHMVVAHLPMFLADKTDGMAIFAEQTGECAHHAMKKTMQRYKLSEDNSRHGEKQLAGVAAYSSWNFTNNNCI